MAFFIAFVPGEALAAPRPFPSEKPKVLDATTGGYCTSTGTSSDGSGFTYALLDDGTLWAWGQRRTSDNYGLFGDGLNLGSYIPRQVEVPFYVTGTKWTQIAAGKGIFAGIRDDGSIWTWGNNSSGQLGNNAIINPVSHSLEPVQVRTDLLSLTGGTWSLCGVGDSVIACFTATNSGNVSYYCWGSNAYGQLGLGIPVSQNVGTPTLIPAPSGGGPGWGNIMATSGDHALGIRANNSVMAWGHDDEGELGLGHYLDMTGALGAGNACSGAGNSVEQLSVNNGQTAAFAQSSGGGGNSFGTLYMWGCNAYGQVNGNLPDSPGVYTPTAINPLSVGLSAWLNASIMPGHSTLLQSGNSVRAWGRNDFGQLGDGTVVGKAINPSAPSYADLGSTWKAIYPTSTHSLATDTNDRLWVWGDNRDSQLGKGMVTVDSDTYSGSGTNNWIPWRIAASVRHSATSLAATNRATFPNNGAVDVSISISRVRVTFDRPMYTELAARGTITLVPSDATVDVASGTWDADGLVFTAPLSNELEPATTYYATVAGFCDTFLGHPVENPMYPYTWIFTTEDIEPPIVISVEPTGTAVPVSTDRIVITFDKMMDPLAVSDGSTLTTPTVTISGGSGSVTIDYSNGEWSTDGMIWSAPLSGLESNTEYTVTIEGFRTKSGIEMDPLLSPHVHTFKTEDDQPYEGKPITYGAASCSTCHYGNVIKEHQRADNCSICHTTLFNQVAGARVTDWNKQTHDMFADALSSQQSCGLSNPACHRGGGGAGSGRRWHGYRPTAISAVHALSVPSTQSGCTAGTGNGIACHELRTLASQSGFSFGEMDLASAHDDYWSAVHDIPVGRAIGPSATPTASIIGNDSPYGCGFCHERTSTDPKKVKAEVRFITNEARGAGDLTCLTCHAPGILPGDHPIRSVSLSAIGLSKGGKFAVPVLPAGTEISDLLEALSPQSKLFFSEPEGNALVPGVQLLPTP